METSDNLIQLKDGTLRFNQIVAKVQPGITQRMLTKELRELEKDGLVIKNVYAGPAESGIFAYRNTLFLIPILDHSVTGGMNT